MEQELTHAQSYGLGMRLTAAPADGLPQAGVSIEWARQNRDDNVREEDRFTFTGYFQF